jgi:hypothetical protein
MATTIFLKPTAVSQNTGASEITWNLDVAPYNVDTSSCSSTALTSYNGKLTGLLIYSGWDTSTALGTLDGIEVKVHSSKKSRIVDSTIQLAQAGTVIGTNKAVSTSGNIHTYGNSTNKWGQSSLAISDLSTLQVALKYGSGAQPHTDTVYVYSVQLKVHYT